MATFSEDLRALGHPTLVVTPAVRGAEVSDEGILRVPAIKDIRGTGFSLRLPFSPGLRRRLDSFQPHIVHTHQPFLLGDTGLREARSRDIPLVFTHHTFYERYADFFGFEHEATRRLARWLPTAYANLCDAVIAPTPSIAEIIRERGVAAPVHVIPTGIDVASQGAGVGRRCRERYGIAPEVPLIGHVGRLIPAKNMSFLARAIAGALVRTPRARALLAGNGESVPTVHRICSEHGVADRVVFTGNLAGQSLADAYAAMDLFAFASRTDTQGLVLVEALLRAGPE